MGTKERQAAFAARQRSAGKRRVAYWLDKDEEAVIKLMVGAMADTPVYPPAKLTGNEAQVKWAKEIRNRAIRELGRLDLRFGRIAKMLGREPTAADVATIVNRMNRIPSAKWWLDHRNADFLSVLLAPEAAGRQFIDEDSERLMAESTLCPAKASGPVAEIALSELEIRVTLGEFSAVANAVLRGSGYQWSSTLWKRTVDDEETAQHRTVEIAVKLLASGSPVLMLDDVLRARIEAGEYLPESSRVVDLSRSEKYGTKYRIRWAFADRMNCRCILARITGVRLFKDGDGAFLPLSRFDVIQDLIEINGFTADAATLDELEKQQAKRDKMIGVTPKVRSLNQGRMQTKPTGGGIDASLLD